MDVLVVMVVEIVMFDVKVFGWKLYVSGVSEEIFMVLYKINVLWFEVDIYLLLMEVFEVVMILLEELGLKEDKCLNK